MSEVTLKDLLKPPYEYCEIEHGGAIYAKDGKIIAEMFGENRNILGKFIADALNEKWEREYGKRKKWRGLYIKSSARYIEGALFLEAIICPACDRQLNATHEIYAYCPNCGERLDAPEEPK